MRQMARAAVSALALATVVAPVVAQLTSCSWTYQGTTYDLSPMTTTGAYRVQDIRASTTSYIFNVCGVTAPPTTNPAAACTSGNRARNALPAAGWQVENDGNQQPDNCYRLGGNQTTGWNFTLFGECEWGPAWRRAHRAGPRPRLLPRPAQHRRRRPGVPSEGCGADLPCR